MAVREQLWRGARWALIGLAGFLLVCLIYLSAAWISASLPSKGRMQADAGTAGSIYLCEAPFHTDFAVPLNDPQANWRAELAGLLPWGLPEDTYLLFGWGDYRFFTEVFQLADLSAGVAVSALAGLNETAVRTLPVSGKDVRESCRQVALDSEGRAALFAHITETLERDDAGAVQSMPTDVYGEILLKAHGRYSPFNTCNQWTAEGLGKAGLPRAAFAPFTFSIMRPLARKPEAGDG